MNIVEVIANFDKSATTFSKGNVVKLHVISKNGPTKVSAKETIITHEILEESDLHNLAIENMIGKCDAIFFKAFSTAVTISDDAIDSLNEFDAILFAVKCFDGEAIIAALVKEKVFSSGFRFSANCSFTHLCDLKKMNHKVIYCEDDIDDDEMFSYMVESDVYDISNYLTSENKKVVYTYSDEILPQIQMIDTSFDYVCFTNVIEKDIYPWKIIKNDFTEEFVKIHPYRLFKNYDISLWVNPNSILKQGFGNVIGLMKDNDYILLKERLNDESFSNVTDEAFLKKLVLNGLSKGCCPCIGTDFIVRKHNEYDCIKMMNNISVGSIQYKVSDDDAFAYSLTYDGGSYLTIPDKIVELMFASKI